MFEYEATHGRGSRLEHREPRGRRPGKGGGGQCVRRGGHSGYWTTGEGLGIRENRNTELYLDVD